MNRATQIILLSFIQVSFLFCILGAWSYWENIHKSDNCTERVTAVCSDMKVSRHTGNSGKQYSNYTPVFSYEYQGKQYEVESGIHFSEKDKDTFRKNEEYTLLLNPGRPRQFVVEGFEEDMDSFALVAMIGGMFTTIIFLLVYFIVKKKCAVE